MTKYEYARATFPKMVDRKLQELQRADPTATFEEAFRRTAAELPDVYQDYTMAVGSG
jgi:hypothetical protein